MKGLIASLFATTALVSADVYMHNPRGSNNRLNEANNNRANGNRLFDSQNNNAGGYNVGPTMYYYVGSRLNVEWTNQHGCGFAHDNLVCNLVMQYMCNPESLLMRNGGTTETANDPEDVPEDIQYGKHETYEYYADCKTRMRNMGLFTADQQVNGNTARFTRQNPNGNRRGYECPEERDYYPYWHPTPWRDIVILTDEFGPASKTQVNRCPYYQSESQNTMSKGYCKDAPWWNNAVDCARGASTPFKTTGDDKRDEEEQKKRKAMTGEWLDYGKWDMPSPECWPTQWSRDNHLGNGIDGYALNYNWTIPDTVYSKCVFRLRYNISTGDYDPWTINSTWNGAMSPIKDNPELKDFYGLQLAINTDQFGRTFQDRSHIFEIRARPSTIPRTTLIQNINVRGKRGNIVQVYPGVEYDFIPNVALVKPGDYVHFQWTGSNTNPQGNDGEGVAGSDKSNIVQLKENDQARSYPAHALDATMFEDATSDKWKNPVEIYFKLSGAPGGGKLNEASTYFDGGLIKLVTKGTFNYMSTRNNNFSNRDQKARLIVSDNAFLADGYNVGAGWRFNSEDPTRSSSKKLSKGALIAAIVAPCAVLVIAVAGYMVMKKPASDSKRVPLRN